RHASTRRRHRSTSPCRCPRSTCVSARRGWTSIRATCRGSAASCTFTTTRRADVTPVVPETEIPDIYAFALAGLSRLAESAGLDPAMRSRLRTRHRAVERSTASLLAQLKSSLQQPHEHDYHIVEAARQFSMTLVEILCVRLTMAAEEEVEVGHAIAQLQQPIVSHRPTVGLLAHAFGETLGARAVQVIGYGGAVQNGVLRVSADDVPLAERQVSVPLPTCLALQGVLAPWPGTRRLHPGIPVPLGKSNEATIERLAAQLSTAALPEVVVIRSAEP